MQRRALLSVSDKTGIVDFARALVRHGFELLSTGGTLKALRDAEVPARSVEDFTGSPEVMDGRVKTLHPRVHGGLLARLGRDDADLVRLGAAPIDVVVVNLYPFERTAARAGASREDIIENIDIGGPSMLRSAAKNHARVAAVCDPTDYALLVEELERTGGLGAETRSWLAAKVFAHTAAYDGAISSYLSTDTVPAPGHHPLPRYLTVALERVAALRYGENPHQSAALYRERTAPPTSLCAAEQFGGKELSFNNYLDLHAAIEVLREHESPAAAVIKHGNPCGLASARSLAEAYRLAREGDPVSAFGGVVALNRTVDPATAEILAETFLECIIAPSFTPEARERLHAKAALRLLETVVFPAASGLDFRRVGGGFAVQDADATGTGEVAAGKVVTKRAPTPEELASLAFAWSVCKHVKSNAIVLARGTQVVGVGAGQMSRVQSVDIACAKAAERAKGSVLASDAFFPFPDGLELAVRHGVTAVAQPGGSKKDADVIAAADAAGVAMVFTGVRHFRH
ncbi:MAG: bifunctional phosphoribosylaminoimidazolecarboxamide formyltransferase/IMP cyclohydrolase [Polyangiaceae bacterium]|nr:bifunctional phosphoribosylaminoimidazolecarboxamide formyltransferase/IMP cyclohydrolase [Polyangiaceae bacterium]